MAGVQTQNRGRNGPVGLQNLVPGPSAQTLRALYPPGLICATEGPAGQTPTLDGVIDVY